MTRTIVTRSRLWWTAVVLCSILALHVDAFVPQRFPTGSALKGCRRTTPPSSPITVLQAEAKKGGDGGKKKKAVKKKATKKKATKKASPTKKSTKKASSTKKATTKKRTTKKKSKASTTTTAAAAATTSNVETQTTIPVVNPPRPPDDGPMTMTNFVRVPSEYDVITSHKPRPGIDIGLLGDMTGGRPGAIIETEEQLALKQDIFDELESGARKYDAKIMDQYGTLQEELEAEYDTDDPEAIDAATLGTWTIRDLQTRYDYEFDPDQGDLDPNHKELMQPGLKYKDGPDVDDEGVEIGYHSSFGPSTALDSRTIVGTLDSYMINEKTKDDSMLPPQFPEGDLEIDYNQEVVKFRKSLDIIETYTDEFLPPTMQIPRHVAKWHGYPEPMSFPHNNKTDHPYVYPEHKPTDFSKLDPYQARRKAVELARAQNADWLPNGKSQAWHKSKREPYERIGTLVGTLQKAPEIDETLVKAIQPALDILGSCVDLLSIEGETQTVFRFAYYGLMKNRHGISCWTETLIQDCGVDVTGVIFETGFRRRDQAYDGGDSWYPPST